MLNFPFLIPHQVPKDSPPVGDASHEGMAAGSTVLPSSGGGGPPAPLPDGGAAHRPTRQKKPRKSPAQHQQPDAAATQPRDSTTSVVPLHPEVNGFTGADGIPLGGLKMLKAPAALPQGDDDIYGRI